MVTGSAYFIPTTSNPFSPLSLSRIILTSSNAAPHSDSTAPPSLGRSRSQSLHLQCDESVPCKKCLAYGVVCENRNTTSALQLSAPGAVNLGLIDFARCGSITRTLTPPLPPSCQPYELRHQDRALLDKFQTRTIVVISPPESLGIYQDQAISRALSVRMLPSSGKVVLTGTLASVLVACHPVHDNDA